MTYRDASSTGALALHDPPIHPTNDPLDHDHDPMDSLHWCDTTVKHALQRARLSQRGAQKEKPCPSEVAGLLDGEERGFGGEGFSPCPGG